VIENLAVAYISSSFRDVFAFGILILVLILRPKGLFGREI
jgi:branched-chain amino acid transport system permease protein